MAQTREAGRERVLFLSATLASVISAWAEQLAASGGRKMSFDVQGESPAIGVEAPGVIRDQIDKQN